MLVKHFYILSFFISFTKVIKLNNLKGGLSTRERISSLHLQAVNTSIVCFKLNIEKCHLKRTAEKGTLTVHFCEENKYYLRC